MMGGFLSDLTEISEPRYPFSNLISDYERADGDLRQC